ncbi:MAG: redox-sensing transcriptional repressor Rex, partial [Acidimicrobiaceae bacterium]
VRKDLSSLGSYGTRGVGYEVTYLIHQIKRELGLLREWNVVVVGAGNLGCALAKFGGFAPRGFPVVGIVDNDAKKIGQTTGALTIGDVRNLGKMVRELNITIGAITTSTATAQSAVDARIDAGVASILNFAPIVLATPSSVSVRNVDLGVELQILSYYEQMRTEQTDGAKSQNKSSAISV